MLNNKITKPMKHKYKPSISPFNKRIIAGIKNTKLKIIPNNITFTSVFRNYGVNKGRAFLSLSLDKLKQKMFNEKKECSPMQKNIHTPIHTKRVWVCIHTPQKSVGGDKRVKPFINFL